MHGLCPCLSAQFRIVRKSLLPQLDNAIFLSYVKYLLSQLDLFTLKGEGRGGKHVSVRQMHLCLSIPCLRHLFESLDRDEAGCV